MRTTLGESASFIQCKAFEFLEVRSNLVSVLKKTTPINRGSWQSQDVSSSDSHSCHEIANLTLSVGVPGDVQTAQRYFDPDLPWAEDHFQERVSGEPLNPAPSYEYWPYHSESTKDSHVHGGLFSHTYPERMWPKNAVHEPDDYSTAYDYGFWGQDGQLVPAYGIRFDYGDLRDVVTLLKKQPFTRQAYLPIWFPEDTGATAGQRVPCSLGYHFIRRGWALDCNYFLRSCDVYRHFSNDVYMAARLAQWVTLELTTGTSWLWPGNLTIFISNLHLFKGDAWRFNR